MADIAAQKAALQQPNGVSSAVATKAVVVVPPPPAPEGAVVAEAHLVETHCKELPI